MSEIFDWAVAAANNDAAPPDGAPEGWAPSAVNAVVREIMAAVKRKEADEDGSLVAAGTSAARTIAAPNRTLTAYYNGLRISARTGLLAAGATLNVSGLGAAPIYEALDQTIGAGRVRAGEIHSFVYNTAHVIPGWDIVSKIADCYPGPNYSSGSTSLDANDYPRRRITVTGTAAVTLTLPESSTWGTVDYLDFIVAPGSCSVTVAFGGSAVVNWSDYNGAQTGTRIFGGATGDGASIRAARIYKTPTGYYGVVYGSTLSGSPFV